MFQKSTTVMPVVKSPFSATEIYTTRPDNSQGCRMKLGTQGPCKGAAPQPYFCKSNGSENVIHPCAAAPPRFPSFRNPSRRSLLASILCVTSNGRTVIGAPLLNTTDAASGSTYT